jgi:hypothetical protein
VQPCGDGHESANRAEFPEGAKPRCILGEVRVEVIDRGPLGSA